MFSSTMISILSSSIYLSFFNAIECKNIMCLVLLVFIFPTWCETSEFHFCHDDFSLNPPDGLLDEYSFPWLGFTQYLHEVTGLLHPNRAPRVVLVHKQFVVTNAKDMLKLPKHYKLGNMIFGDYEQEAKDCGLSSDDVMMGKRCPRAYMEMPYSEILPHPEFSRYSSKNSEINDQLKMFCRFGVNNSVALVQLLRPMKSHFMLPACLPTLEERTRKKTLNIVFLIDYISAVPRDFDFEKMGKRTLKLFKDTDCIRYQNETVVGNKGLSQFLCSSGCGMRSGAPIISHAADGRFELIGLAVGGSRCKDQGMRRRFNENPPFYIDVHPYVPWIKNVINAHKIPKPYPQNFQLLEGGSRMGTRRSGSQKSGWKGRTYLLGANCFGSWKVRKQASLFYMEKFEARATTEVLPTTLNITVKISSGIECINACYRILLPHRLIKPNTETKGMIFTLNLNIVAFSKTFSFSLGISGRNASRRIYEDRKKDIQITDITRS